MLGDMLKRRGIKHSVLNAKFHEKEAEIVAQAGRSGAVTIATNMAGRGTDILLGGNPEVLAAELLHKARHQRARGVAGAVRRRRWPRRTRSAPRTATGSSPPAACTSWAPSATRRGGSTTSCAAAPAARATRAVSRFYLSLEDDLMRRFASDRVQRHHGPPWLRRRDGPRVRDGEPDDRGRPDPGRGLQLRHAQARRRVRRRDQPPARDDLPRARADPALEGPAADHPGHARRRGRAASSPSTPRTTTPASGTSTGCGAPRWPWSRSLTDAGLAAIDEDAERRADRALVDALAEALRAEARPRPGRRDRHPRAPRPAAGHRLPWVEHLTAVDDMRRGIGLRAYSQRDPLNEFKIEAYRMFDELKTTIRHDVTHTIFRVTRSSSTQPARRGRWRATSPRARRRRGHASRSRPVPTRETGRATAARAEPVRTGPKIGRNDPCWCGSGKKYKRCHGA